MAGGEASRVEPAEQADLGVYGVGESPSSPSPGLQGPNQLTTPKALWMEAGMAGGEASRVEPAEQADLGVYGVGESHLHLF